MNSFETRPLRRLFALGAIGLVAAAATGCGTPRVHEVYRLSSLEPFSEAVSTVTDERLTAAQADLRQLSINALQLAPVRSRQYMASASAAPRDAGFALGPSSSLHGCTPDYLAEFTGGSSSEASAAFAVDGLLASSHRF